MLFVFCLCAGPTCSGVSRWLCASLVVFQPPRNPLHTLSTPLLTPKAHQDPSQQVFQGSSLVFAPFPDLSRPFFASASSFRLLPAPVSKRLQKSFKLTRIHKISRHFNNSSFAFFVTLAFDTTHPSQTFHSPYPPYFPFSTCSDISLPIRRPPSARSRRSSSVFSPPRKS